MERRPQDWSPVADGDPVPGDPDRVAALGKKLRRTADELSRQIKNLKAVAEVDAWDSDAGREFRKKAEGNVGKLQAAYKRYDAAADALGTRVDEIGGGYQDKLHAKPTNYATDLNRAQEIADAALKEAKSADERKGEAQRSLDHLSGDAEKSKKQNLEDAVEASGGDISAARKKIEEAKRIRDEAAKRARDAIDNVISGDSLEDGFWDTFLTELSDIMGTIASVAGVLSLLVGWIPVIGQALGGILGTIAMVASLVSFACSVVLFLRGHGDLADIGMAAVGFLMMGVGKAFSKVAGKYAGKALKRLNKMRSGPSGSGKAMKRNRQKLNQLNQRGTSLTPGEFGKSLIDPFADVFTKSGWQSTMGNVRTVMNRDNWRMAREGIEVNGGVLKSVSLVDSEVGSTLKAISNKSADFADNPQINKVASNVKGLTAVGYSVMTGNVLLDENISPIG